MNDLISRSVAIDLLYKYADQKFVTDGVSMANGILKAKCFIDNEENIPTAFDLDKVIAEMEEMIDPNVDFATGIPCDNWVVDMQNEIIAKCIEIVKKGGVHNPHSRNAEPPKTD